MMRVCSVLVCIVFLIGPPVRVHVQSRCVCLFFTCLLRFCFQVEHLLFVVLDKALLTIETFQFELAQGPLPNFDLFETQCFVFVYLCFTSVFGQ